MNASEQEANLTAIAASSGRREPAPLVQVLLSAYNGARFLPEQLDSLLGQDHRPLQILIRDDGSTDTTMQVLEGYARHPEVRIIRSSNIGAVRSYFELLTQSSPDADYLALCDQDDVWHPGKISRAVKLLSEVAPGRPAVYACRLMVVDQDLRPLGPSRLPRRPLAFGNALVENALTGCTMVLNRVARNLVTARLPDFALMHDAWIYLVLSALGEIRFDPQPGMLYRQHAQNTIGVGPSGIKKWVWRTRRFFARKQRYSDQVVEFRKLFADHLTADQIRLVDLVIDARNSFAGRVCLALSRRVYRQRAIDDALLRLVALVGRL